MNHRMRVLALSAVCVGVITTGWAGPSARTPHIVSVEGEALTLITGRTQTFTVDTPEDQGVVSTQADIKTLQAELAAWFGDGASSEVTTSAGVPKPEGQVERGDRVAVSSGSGSVKRYTVALQPAAMAGRLELEQATFTAQTRRDLVLFFTTGQRSPDVTVELRFPPGITPTLDNSRVNVIGRGEVTLRDLPKQSIGRVGSAYSYSKVGDAAIERSADGGTTLTLRHLDLRPANGPDIKLVVGGVALAKPGEYSVRARYTTSQPDALQSAGVGGEVAVLNVVPTISDFARRIDRSRRYRETPTTYTSVDLFWSAAAPAQLRLLHSLDEGKTWLPAEARPAPKNSTLTVAGLAPDRMHAFKLEVLDGPQKGMSNLVWFYAGKRDVKSFGAVGDGKSDDTEKINAAIDAVAATGGGTLRFTAGEYAVRTVHLRSNVWLYVERGATISALKGGDAPEATWFSDRKYRSGLSPTDAGPYAEPENWLTKQDVGHHYFRNSMFFGERLDNVKIVGSGRITGNNNLVTGDNVMRNGPENRSDKMFTLKLCTNLEIGGLTRDEDLWYDADKDEPCYLGKDGTKHGDLDNLLHIDRAGHFVLLATGTDGIDVHDTYIGQHGTGNSRDIYDFMQCNDVVATNIYCKVSSDDIVKPGSDCSLGFTRPAKDYRVRNIVGDTNCNLFQIGSETADDITDLYVDNIYVLGGNKAGFSISTNDGAHVKNVYLNSGKTGRLHSRSQMRRTHTPFFISISNRGRVLGATVARFKFDEAGKAHDELLNTNIDIGVVENVVLNGVDVTEMYAGSSYRPPRWKPYDGTQPKQAPIVAGYKLPEARAVQGGLTFKLPNGQHTGYVRNVVFNDIHFLAKGGNPKSDVDREPPELGVGQYNASNLGVLPAYGLYARHVAGLTISHCDFNFEKHDSTPAMLFDDVVGAKVQAVKAVRASDQPLMVKVRDSRDISLEEVTCYTDAWGTAPVNLPAVKNVAGDITGVVP
jgi:polygalacturonase